MAKLAKQIVTLLRNKFFLKTSLKDWILKAISLTLAIFLWYFVVGEDQVDMNVQVPLEILNLPADLVISNQFKKDINVSVRGPRSMIQDLRNRNITRAVNLAGKKTGAFVLQNDENSIDFPRGITVLRLQPTDITLLLDKLVRKKFPIEPITKGEPAPGYTLDKITLNPSHLTISGPQKILDSEDTLDTYIIDITNLEQTTTLQVNLNLKQEFINFIGETVVTVQLDVSEKVKQKTVKNITVNVRESDQPVTVSPDRISVNASIPVNLIRDTPELSMLFRASIAASGITQKTQVQVTVNGVNVPGHDSIVIHSVKPDQVMVSPISMDKKIQEILKP